MSHTADHARRAARLLLALTVVGAALGACSDPEPVNPPALKSPARVVYTPRCVGPDRWYAPDDCPEGIALEPRGYITNEESASLAFFEIDGSQAQLLDTRQAMPSLSPIPVGLRPRALAATPDGAFILTINTGSRDLSLVEADRQRELARVTLPAVPLDLVADPARERFLAIYDDGALRAHALRFDCGAGPNVYTSRAADGAPTCALTADDVSLSLQTVATLAATPSHLQLDPVRPLLYITHADQPHVSVLTLDPDSAEACLDPGAAPPCEVARLGASFGCSDGLDNDGDGLIDALDPQCYRRAGAESPEGVGVFQSGPCNDGLDDDDDGLIDLLDPGCLSPNDADETPGLTPLEPGPCTNGLDDDGDGLVDNRDPGCLSPDGAESLDVPVDAACADGADNDGDGLSDFPDDPDCDSADDDNEADQPACANGVDDDGDSLIDLDDLGCLSADDDSERLSAPACANGVDDDGDGLIDLADDACYGAAGLSERGAAPRGLGAMGVDPEGRWLYVTDPDQWQVVVIDLEARALVPAGLLTPLHGQAGVRVNPLPRAIIGDTVTVDLFDQDGVKVTREEARFIVATTNGTLDVGSVHQRFVRAVDGVEAEVFELLPLRLTDTRANDAVVISKRCVNVRCDRDALPDIDLRQRPIVLVGDDGALSATDPDDGGHARAPADELLRSEGWQIVYEGVLPGSERSDALISADEPGRVDGRGADYCAIGVQPGDHLLIEIDPNEFGRSLDLDACRDLLGDEEAIPRYEWRVTAVRPHALYVEVIDEPGFVDVLPSRRCLNTGVAYSVRASEQWVVSGEATDGLLALEERQGTCQPPTYDRLGPGRLITGVPYSNALFRLTLEEAQVPAERDAALEFEIINNYNVLRRNIGPLPGDLRLIDNGTRRFLLIPDAGSNQVFIYDADSFSSLNAL